MRERSVRFFRNTCPSCRNDVGVPLLGDAAYGTLVFQTVDGKEFAFAEVIAEQAWDEIAQLCQAEFGFDSRQVTPSLATFQHVATRCADPLHGKRYTTHFPLCPECGERLRLFGDADPMHNGRIPFAGWRGFMSLAPEQKRRLVIMLWHEESAQSARL
jgi:hypothetical protein